MAQDLRQDGAIWALGTMSGTSLDGVDAAMVLTDGTSVLEFGPTAFRPYSDAEQQVLRAALGCWPDDPRVPPAARIVEDAHAEVLARFQGARLAGFHGQTFAHDPGGRGTHQAGDGARLARLAGLPVLWDFRTADVAAGGQGAPLAPFYHFALARRLGDQPVVFLNLGGVGNLTWADPASPGPEHPGALFAFDTGPANAPVNDLMMRRLGVSHDRDGALAAQGHVDEALVARFLQHPHFALPAPKSLDRDAFAGLGAMVEGLADADAAATLTACAAAAVAAGVALLPAPPARVLVGGGGRLNPVMMRELSSRLPCPVEPVEAAGLDGDMLEAQAFAHLAVRVARGMATSTPGTTATPVPVCGGRLSRP